MSLDQLRNRLIDAARAEAPSDEVPLGFERRVMNHLKCLSTVDAWAHWAQALWRAAAPCVGIALLLALWTMVAPQDNRSANQSDVSQQFENTVLAAVTIDQPVSEPVR